MHIPTNTKSKAVSIRCIKRTRLALGGRDRGQLTFFPGTTTVGTTARFLATPARAHRKSQPKPTHAQAPETLTLTLRRPAGTAGHLTCGFFRQTHPKAAARCSSLVWSGTREVHTTQSPRRSRDAAAQARKGEDQSVPRDATRRASVAIEVRHGTREWSSAGVTTAEGKTGFVLLFAFDDAKAASHRLLQRSAEAKITASRGCRQANQAAGARMFVARFAGEPVFLAAEMLAVGCAEGYRWTTLFARPV